MFFRWTQERMRERMKGGFCKEQQKSVGQMSRSLPPQLMWKPGGNCSCVCPRVSDIPAERRPASTLTRRGDSISLKITLWCQNWVWDGQHKHTHLFLLNPLRCVWKNPPPATVLKNPFSIWHKNLLFSLLARQREARQGVVLTNISVIRPCSDQWKKAPLWSQMKHYADVHLCSNDWIRTWKVNDVVRCSPFSPSFHFLAYGQRRDVNRWLKKHLSLCQEVRITAS